MITAQKTPKYIRLRCFRTEYVELTTARVQFPLDSLPSLTPIKSKVQSWAVFYSQHEDSAKDSGLTIHLYFALAVFYAKRIMCF